MILMLLTKWNISWETKTIFPINLVIFYWKKTLCQGQFEETLNKVRKHFFFFLASRDWRIFTAIFFRSRWFNWNVTRYALKYYKVRYKVNSDIMGVINFKFVLPFLRNSNASSPYDITCVFQLRNKFKYEI